MMMRWTAAHPGAVLLAACAGGGQRAMEQADPLWAGRDVVEDDARQPVDVEVWEASNHFAAHRVPDDLERALSRGDA